MSNNVSHESNTRETSFSVFQYEHMAIRVIVKDAASASPFASYALSRFPGAEPTKQLYVGSGITAEIDGEDLILVISFNTNTLEPVSYYQELKVRDDQYNWFSVMSGYLRVKPSSIKES